MIVEFGGTVPIRSPGHRFGPNFRAFCAGYKAFEDGLSTTACPHSLRSTSVTEQKKRSAWMRGYKAAKGAK